MSVLHLAHRHRPAVYLATILITLGGLWALFTLPAGIYPEVAFPRIIVLAKGGTFDAGNMTVAVTRPLEEAMSGVIDLRRIRSKTIRGGVEISLDFHPRADMQFSLQQVQARLAALQSSLPPGIEISAERLTPSVFPIVQYVLTGADPALLRDLAQYTIRPRLAHLPDVGEVEVMGGSVREISVILNPERLINYHLSVVDVAAAIRDANVTVSAGRLDRQYRQFGIVVSGLRSTPAAVAGIVVRGGDQMVRVGDLSTVSYGTADKFELTTGNGQPAALVNVSRQPSGNALTIQRAVKAVTDSLRPLLPAGVRLALVYDQGTLVRESIGSVRDAMLVGGVLAVLVLILFLGQLRITLSAALAIPLTLVGTFLGLLLTGQSLNLMSLGGLAVAIGLVIDDAVVVVENIERRFTRDPGQPTRQAIQGAVSDILAAVVGSTVTTVVVFIPLGLLEGVVGDFFRAFAIALSIAVGLSLVFAVVLVPALLGHWMEGRNGTAVNASGHGPAGRFQIRLGGVEEMYGRLMRRILGRPLMGLGLAGLLLILAVGMYRLVGTGFLPTMDEGGFILDYATPTGTSLAETDRQLRLIEQILRKDPDVAGFSRRTGAELGLFATAQNTGDFAVLLKSPAERNSSVYQVIDRVRQQAEEQVPAVRVEFVQILQDVLGDLAGAPKPVEVKLFSPNQRALESAARQVAAAIENTPGLVDLFDGVVGDIPQLRVDLDPVRVARLGLTPHEAGLQARAALFGEEAGAAQEPDRLVPIRVRLPDDVRFAPDAVARVPVTGPAGWSPLGTLGAARDTMETAELQRENLRSMIAVTGSIEGADLGSVMRGIRHEVGGLTLPSGVTLELGGQYASQRSSFRQLLMVFALAVGAVLLVLVVQFRDFRSPLMIIAAAGLGLTGAVTALALTGVPLNVSSFMGLILLVGLVVKNSIILLDAAARQRARGLSAAAALIEGGRLRLRPILMTTLCTIAGLLPLALGFGAGAELQRPLAIAVIGGLTLSTIVTLVLLPAGINALGALKGETPEAGLEPATR